MTSKTNAAPSAEPGWRAIETYPHDTPVILANFTNKCLLSGAPHVWTARYATKWVSYSETGEEAREKDGPAMWLECSFAATNENGAPTHWMPLPPAPGASPEPLLPVPYPKREDVSDDMRARFERLFADEQGRNHSTLRRNEQGAYANLRVAADWTFYQRAWADALEAAAPGASEGVTDEQIRATFLAHGFTVKEGQTDLKPYVYEAARALLALAPPAPVVQPAAQDETLRNALQEILRVHANDNQRPKAFYIASNALATPPAPQTDRQQESAAAPAIGAPSGWPDYIAGLLEAYLKTNPDPANREQGFAGIIRRRMYWLASTQAEPSPQTDRQSEGEARPVTAFEDKVLRNAAGKRVAPPAAAQDEAREYEVYWEGETRPLDYLQGYKDGCEWAAQMAELEDPRTSDWVYDDPHALAAAIRKGPELPPAAPVEKPA